MKIDIAHDIVDRYDERDVIEYLKNTVSGINQTYAKAVNERDPNLLFSQLQSVDIIYRILRELDRRNKEKSVE